MFSNLLGNAVKFTDDGGVVLRVSVQRSAEAGLRLVAEIEDAGPGVADDEMGRLFQPFEQTTDQRDDRIGVSPTVGVRLLSRTRRHAGRAKDD